MPRFKLSLLAFFFFSLVYSLNTYFILIKDHFILERLALVFNRPAIESQGIALSYSLHANSLSTLLLLFALLGLSLSFLGIIVRPPTLTPRQYLFLFLALGLVYLISYPSLSSDVFDYNNYNRVQYLHNVSPWLYPANTFPHDQTIYFGNWIDRPSVYPLLSHLFFGLNYFLFGAAVPLAILGFKLLNLVLLGLVFYLAFSSAPSHFPLLFFNPLVWLEFVGNGHNDLLVGLLVLLFALNLSSSRFLLAGIYLAASVFVKVSTAILLPLVLLKLVLFTTINSIVAFTLTFAATSALCLLPMRPFLPHYFANLNHQTHLLLRSLAFVFRSYYLRLLGGEPFFDLAQKYQKITTSFLFAALNLLLLKRLRVLPFADLIVAVFLIYLIFASPMLSPWYFGWFITLIPFVQSPRLRLATLVFSLTSLLSYPMYLISLYLQPFIDFWQLAMYLVMVSLPLLILILPGTWYHRFVPRKVKL